MFFFFVFFFFFFLRLFLQKRKVGGRDVHGSGPTPPPLLSFSIIWSYFALCCKDSHVAVYSYMTRKFRHQQIHMRRESVGRRHRPECASGLALSPDSDSTFSPGTAGLPALASSGVGLGQRCQDPRPFSEHPTPAAKKRHASPLQGQSTPGATRPPKPLDFQSRRKSSWARGRAGHPRASKQEGTAFTLTFQGHSRFTANHTTRVSAGLLGTSQNITLSWFLREPTGFSFHGRYNAENSISVKS